MLFHPGVESRPPTCGESGLGRHGPATLAGEASRVLGQVHQVGGRQVPGHLHHRRARPTRRGALGEQVGDVGGIRVIAGPHSGGERQRVEGCPRISRADPLAVDADSGAGLCSGGGHRIGRSLCLGQPVLIGRTGPQDEHRILGDRVRADVRRIRHRVPSIHPNA